MVLCYQIHCYDFYKNLSMQYDIQRIFQKTKMNISLNFDIFNIFTQNIDCGYTLEPPRRYDSNEYPQSICFGSEIRKYIYPCKPKFFLYKSGLQWGILFMACFHDDCQNDFDRFWQGFDILYR